MNLLLLAVAGYLGYRLYDVTTMQAELPAVIEGAKTADAGKKKKPAVQQKKKSYDIIKNFNLFNPSRVSVVQKTETISSKPLPKNRPRLFGTVILGDLRTAIIEDPSTRKRKMYKVNESVGDYKVSEILKDRVVLLWNGEKVEVKLREDKGIKPTPMAQVRKTQQLQRRQQRTTSRTRPRRPRRIRRNVPPPPPPQAGEK
jgi:hypothetical protein